MIIQSTPVAQSTLLKNILDNKFPHTSFTYLRFPKTGTENSKGGKRAREGQRLPDGIIAELKSLKPSQWRSCERMMKHYKGIPFILVLSPTVFTAINARARKILDDAVVVLSDIKSFEYVLQLPRLMEEVSRKRRLRHQNERLQRMLLERQGQPIEEKILALGSANDFSQTRRIVDDLLKSDRSPGCALKVTLKNWSRTKNSFSPAGQTEILDLVVRLIGRVVRNSDRVLRSEEDEFTVFLSNAHPGTLNRCKERLESSLGDLRIEANEREIRFPFSISTIQS